MKTYTSLLANIILLLSAFLGVAFAQQEVAGVSTGNSSPACLEYAMTANLSTTGANSSYRAAFLIASPVGTLSNQRMLSAAQAKLPALTSNRSLNEMCGNLTTIAFVEAEKNFTKGIVAQFENVKPTGIRSGPEVLVIVGGIMLFFSGVWSFMP
jgi:hypothetical protein